MLCKHAVTLQVPFPASAGALFQGSDGFCLLSLCAPTDGTLWLSSPASPTFVAVLWGAKCLQLCVCERARTSLLACRVGHLSPAKHWGGKPQPYGKNQPGSVLAPGSCCRRVSTNTSRCLVQGGTLPGDFLSAFQGIN